MAFITAETRSSIVELAMGMLNQAPSSELLTTLIGKSTAGASLQDLADYIATTDAFTAEYPATQTAREFATEMFGKLITGGTLDADINTAVIDLLEGLLIAGTTKAEGFVAVIDFLSNSDNASHPDLGDIAQSFQNRADAAEYFSITKELGGSTDAELAAAIASVTSDAATLTAANAAADTTAEAEAIVPGEAFTLTTGQDAKTLSAGADSIAGSLVGAGAAGTTAQPGDTVNGGAGEDKLTLSVSGDSAGAYTLQALITDSVEILHVNNFETDAAGGARNTVTTIDGALMKGLTEVGLASSSAEGDTKFANVMNIVDVAMQNGSGDLEVAYGSGVTTGTQTQNIALSNVAAGTLAIGGVENLNISSGLVKSTLTALTAAQMKSISVTGSTDLKITGALDFANDATGVAGAIDGTIDASAFTGKLTVTSAADEVSITGGSGNDTFNMAATFNGYDKIDGGDGTDTLTMDAAALSTQFAQTSNIENVTFNESNADTTVDMSKLSAGVEKFTADMADDNDGGAKIALTVTKADGKLINVVRSSADVADAGADDGVTMAVTNTVDTTDDTLNLMLTDIGLQADLGGLDSLDASTYETINITANAVSTALGGDGKNEIVALTATVAKTVTVDGSGAFNTALTGTKVTNFDASGLAGALTLTAGSEKATYSMGGKSSTIIFGGNLNASDTVIGGAGTADIVTANASGLTATTGALNISDVEYVLLTTGGANKLDLSGTTGLSNLAVTDNKQTITGIDLATTTIHLGLAADQSATASEIDVTAADATGADDTLKVIVNSTAGAPSSTIDASAIENLSITVGRSTTGTNNATTLDLTTFEGSKASLGTAALAAGVTVTAGAVDLGALHKNTTTLVSTNKAAVTASFANATTVATYEGLGAGIQTITGGLRGDTFTIGSTGAVAHVITGGSGTDTTNLTAATGLADVSTINTENVNIAVPASVDVTITGDFNAGVDAITITGGNSLSTFDAGTIDTAIKSIDASAFLGNLKADFAADVFDGTVTVTAGDLTTDEITAVLTTDGTYAVKSTGVETLNLESNGDVTVNLAGTEGVTVVEVDLATAAKTLTISNVDGEAVRLSGSTAATNVLEAVPVDATDDANAISFQLYDEDGIAADTKLKTTDVETVSITSVTAESVDLSLLTMSSATKTVALNLFTSPTTLAGITLSATSAQTTTINAANAYGVTQNARSATSAVEYTGSIGNDTFIMMNTGDKISGGDGTSDTLTVNYGAVLGGISVNLSATGEQISTLDGGAISGSVTGFENVNLSGYTGFGASITAIKTGSTIVGTDSSDRITGGAGADIVSGGDGKDVINTGSGNDTVKDTVANLVTDVDVLTLGSGTDTVEITDSGAVNFTGMGAFAAEAIVVATDAGADAVVLNDGQFNTGSVSITLTGAVDGDDDTIRIENGGTAFEAAAEAAAADVDIAGEWHFVADDGDDATLTYYNETNGGVTTLTIIGLDAGAIAVNANDLLFTA